MTEPVPEAVARTAKTARARRKMSTVGMWLLKMGHLRGRVLDFGCGRGDLAEFIAAFPGCKPESHFPSEIYQWDPNWQPKRPRGKFDTVACIYVLNVLPPAARKKALQDAQSFVRNGGRLYVAVRRDLDTEPNVGPDQYSVKLGQSFRSIYRRSGKFEIYEWVNV